MRKLLYRTLNIIHLTSAVSQHGRISRPNCSVLQITGISGVKFSPSYAKDLEIKAI